MPSLPKSHLRSLAVGVHGGVDYQELERLGLRPEDVVDFSVNSNPFGPPPSVREAVSRAAIDRYPDPEATGLRRRLASRHGVEMDSILATNGSVEAIWCACLAYLRPGDRVLVCGPTFGEYEIASRIAGAEVIALNAGEEDGFRLDVRRVRQTIARWRPRLVFLCNPNNPTGAYLAKGEVAAVLSDCGDGLLALDEAYVGFVPDHWSSLDLLAGGNLLILRSLTKDFALAGLRLGYAIAGPEVVSSLRKVKPPWSVNAVAQEAGIAALGEDSFLDGCRERILAARDYLVAEFRRLGFPVVESPANFFLVKVGDAHRFRAALLRRGLLVRDCASFGLPEYVRIAPRRIEECERLVREWERSGP